MKSRYFVRIEELKSPKNIGVTAPLAVGNVINLQYNTLQICISLFPLLFKKLWKFEVVTKSFDWFDNQ